MSGNSNGGPRKRSRSSSSASNSSPSAFHRFNGNKYRPSSRLTPPPHQRNKTNYNNSGEDSSDQRLLRLNVGGYPYDVVRTSLPLLETMMTDRWLSSCLVDSDGRIFLDRDGDAFGDILRYFRGGADFLLELVNANNISGGSGNNARNGVSRTGGGRSQPIMASSGLDRLRRMRVEGDYYGLHQLVHDIDVVTIGERVIFSNDSWARVAGTCLPRNNGNRNDNQNQPNFENQNNVAAGDGDDENANGNVGVDAHRNIGNRDANAGGFNLDEADAAVENANNDGNEVIQNQQQGDEMNPDAENVQLDEDNDDGEEDNVENDEEDENEDGEENDEDEEEAEEEEIAEDDNEEDNEEHFIFEEEEDDNQEDPNQPPPYKYWSWSRQYGNPQILRPHPTLTSSMVVGQDGTYLLLLRVAAALPSPLARIKWDQEEEEDRRMTRGALRRRGDRQKRSDSNNDEYDNDDFEDRSGDNQKFGGKEVEEDYFVTVNIEAPLQTVMDSLDESQTHFPLLRAGLWDYRTEEEVLHEDPVFATVCAMDVVSLRAGDVLSVNFMNDEISRESTPFPDDAPPELMNSLTLVKVQGNTMARYERLKSAHSQFSLRKLNKREGLGDFSQRGAGRVEEVAHDCRGVRGRRNKPDYPNDQHVDESHECDAESFHNHLLDDEAEEFDRSLTRTAHWMNPRNDFLPTPFQPPLHSHSAVVEFPHPGHYLLLGRVAVGCRRDATFLPVLSGGPLEGHRVQLSVRSAGGRLLHAVGAFAFEDKPRLGCSDLSILSDNGMFNDVVHVAQPGTELSITTTGDCRLHPEGTEVGPFCSAVSQSLSVLLLDDDAMEVDRYMIGTTRAEDQRREIKWYHTRTSSETSCGIGGTPSQPSLFDIDGHRLVWRGFSVNEYQQQGASSVVNSSVTVLIIGSIPPLHRGYVLGILKNDEPLAISITPESLDMKGRHCHYFQEIVELSTGDEISIAECAYGGEGVRGWSAQLHTEPRRVELDTRMGHLSFVVLENGGQCAGGDKEMHLM